MYAWFNLTSSSSEDTDDRAQALSYLALERAKARAAAAVLCLCLSWHMGIAIFIESWDQKGTEHAGPHCPSPVQQQTGLACSGIPFALPEQNFFLFLPQVPHSESGSKLITHLSYCRVLWWKSLSFSHTTRFSELILLVVPIVWQLPKPHHWLAVSWLRVSLSSCNEMQEFAHISQQCLPRTNSGQCCQQAATPDGMRTLRT